MKKAEKFSLETQKLQISKQFETFPTRKSQNNVVCGQSPKQLVINFQI